MAQYITLPEFDKFKTNNLKGYFICNVCRLCANLSDNVVPIFDKIDEKGSVYSKLKKCLPSILVSNNVITILIFPALHFRHLSNVRLLFTLGIGKRYQAETNMFIMCFKTRFVFLFHRDVARRGFQIRGFAAK